MRRFLRANGFTQVSLAEAMDVTQPYVSQLVTGKSNPGLDVVENVATALGVDPIELLKSPPPQKNKKNKRSPIVSK